MAWVSACSNFRNFEQLRTSYEKPFSLSYLCFFNAETDSVINSLITIETSHTLADLEIFLEGGWTSRHGLRNFFQEGRITPTRLPIVPHQNSPYLDKEGRQEVEGKEAGERSEPRKFGVFGRKIVPK